MAQLYVKYSQQALIEHYSSLFFIVLQSTLPRNISQCNRPSFARYILVNEELFSSIIVLGSAGHRARNAHYSSTTGGRNCKTPQAKE